MHNNDTNTTIQQKLWLFSPVKFLTNAPLSMVMKGNAFYDDLNTSALEKERTDLDHLGSSSIT